MDFCVEIAKIWQKSRDFKFVEFCLEIFKIHGLVGIFGCFKFVSCTWPYPLINWDLFFGFSEMNISFMNGCLFDQRWKSQRIKIQWVAYRFSLDFKIHTVP